MGCGEPNIQWAWRLLGICTSEAGIVWSSVIGYISVGFWILALMPQLYKNYKNKEADSLSVYFVLAWCLGDLTNLVGCILTHQLVFQTLVGAFYGVY